ncbi:MAG: hypothetical protein QOG58_1098 [Caballeronia sp.]|jgi:hypothetical protein|nr:hypothetical protein [Caballeronia sp.]
MGTFRSRPVMIGAPRQHTWSAGQRELCHDVSRFISRVRHGLKVLRITNGRATTGRLMFIKTRYQKSVVIESSSVRGLP